MSQQEMYDDVYLNADTLWDDADSTINEILNGDFENKQTELRQVHCKGIVLNLGAGAGPNLSELTDLADEVVCIDISRIGLERAKKRHDSVTYILADARCLPFKEDVFDYVEGLAILHHISEYDEVFDQLGHCAKKGSSMLFVEPGILNPQAFVVRNFFPTPFHVPEEKPFVPCMLKKEMNDAFGKNSTIIHHFSVLTYGGSLIIKSNSFTVPFCKLARKVDTIIEKIPLLRQFAGQLVIEVELDESK